MEPNGHTILIVDDNIQERNILGVTLQAQGYRVLTAPGGDGVGSVMREHDPGLVLIAANMATTNGFQLCRQLKSNPATKSVPVIFITTGRDPTVIDQTFASGAVDTIIRPCHLNEFLSRVRTHLELRQLLIEIQKLRELDIDANPLTHLPGNNSITTAIQKALDEARDEVVIYTDLDNFKAYNDAYGFGAGDDVLLFNAETLYTALRTVCPGQGFLGHVGGDDFVILVPAGAAEELGQRIIEVFDAGVPNLYNSEDQQRGSILATDRRGSQQRFPLLSISMGGVALRSYGFKRFVEVATICAEVKHAAKQIPGSNLFMDRRGKGETSKISPLTQHDLVSG